MRRRPAAALAVAALAMAPLLPAPAGATPYVAAPVASSLSTTHMAAADTTLLAPTDTTLVWRAGALARVLLGRTVGGRPIVARRLGRSDAPYVLLLVGQMHGDEPKGRAVVAALRRTAAIRDVQVWTISTINPDGSARNTRTNARGVDLNRNFPDDWRSGATRYNGGSTAASERETRAAMRWLDRLRPDLVLSLHQAYRSIDDGNPKTRSWVHRIAPLFGLPIVTVPCKGPCVGTMTGWYNHTYVGQAITVELPASRAVTTAKIRRYVRAVRSSARLVRDLSANPSAQP